MSKVYVVISETIYQGHSSHGLHGVYSDKTKAITTAISAITGIANRHYYEVSTDDICVDDLEFSYASGNIEIYLSCIEQDVR